jgi:hypothetical protein
MSLMGFFDIEARNGVLRLQIGSAMVVCSEDKLTIDDEGVNICVQPNLVELHMGDSEAYLSPSHFEFNAANRVLYAAADGTERMGEIATGDIPKKKNLEVVPTHWGNLLPLSKPTLLENDHIATLQRFQPYFFVVRSDLSGSQYLRADGLTYIGEEQRSHTVEFGMEAIEVVSFHSPDTDPSYCLKHKPLSKLDRTNVLKNVHVEKPKKKGTEADVDETIVAEAATAVEQLMNYWAQIPAQLEELMETWHSEYITDITPPPPPPPEVLIIPPATPTPRRLKAARELNITEHNHSYWNTHEGDFAFPMREAHKPGIPMSPRTALFDPPREFKSRKKASEPTRGAFLTQNTPLSTRRQRDTPRAASEMTVRKEPVSFGEVKLGGRHIRTIRVRANATRPLKFRVDPVADPALQVRCSRGMIAPGLPHLLKIELDGLQEGHVSEDVQFHTPVFDLTIPVDGVIVSTARPPAKLSEEEEKGEHSARRATHTNSRFS